MSFKAGEIVGLICCCFWSIATSLVLL